MYIPKRQTPMHEVEHVHPQRPRLQLIRDPHRALIILRMDPRRQPIRRIVRLPDNLLLIGELMHGDHRAENLLLHNPHARLDVREDGRLDPIPIRAVSVAVGFSAKSDGGAFLLADIEVGFDLVVLDLGVLRALVGGGVEVVADFNFFQACGEELAELVVDVFVYVDAGAGVAGLAVVPGQCQQRVLFGVPWADELWQITTCRRQALTY